MRIALAQLNPTVGDVDANARLVADAAARAHAAGADLVVCPEQVIAGYPADDLWLADHFVARCRAALDAIAPLLAIPAIVGLPLIETGRRFNAAAFVADGGVQAWYRKQHLPNYEVFDEERWFDAGSDPLVVDVADAAGRMHPVGVTICEDGWIEHGPVRQSVDAGARIVVNISASPWRVGRGSVREQVVVDRARETSTWMLLCNQVGGQDELVFDGSSVAASPDGTIVARGAAFSEDLVVVDTDDAAARGTSPAPRVDVRVDADADSAADPSELWAALVLGTRDYVVKNGFSTVLLGLSGGIDSALVLALAVDAVGAEHVHAITMPSRYSAGATRADAHLQAERLGVSLQEIPIEPIVAAFSDALAPSFTGTTPDVTEENLQSRIRGTLLMASSNKHGHLVLATGNKSELSVGYATLYGDMNGGFSPIKDVLKTRLFALARWRNEAAAAAGLEPVIPLTVIERPPTAELRAHQLDSDALPEYDELDALLELLVERACSIEDAVAAGHDHATVLRVRGLVDRAEYKRRQAAPGVRVTGRAFGRDRRIPITNRFDGRGVAVEVVPAV